MNWLLRALIAVFAGAGLCILIVIVLDAIYRERAVDFQFYYGAFRAFSLVSIPATLIYALLGLIPLFKERAPETRCRKCQYILKGISEPICPECGERI
jgi:hypothetical protein